MSKYCMNVYGDRGAELFKKGQHWEDHRLIRINTDAIASVEILDTKGNFLKNLGYNK